jgi:hypothetical protein
MKSARNAQKMSTPEWNTKLGPLAGSLRVRAGGQRDIDTNFHGWLLFYGDCRTDEMFEYRAKFTDGKVVELTPR